MDMQGDLHGLRNDLPDSEANARCLKSLYTLAMTLSGDPVDVFRRSVRIIADTLDVPIVCLSEIRGAELHFLAVYARGEIVADAGSCPLAITPCATVMQTKEIGVFDRVAARFPEAAFLKVHNAVSYCGFPSLDSDGNVVAVTCLLDDKARTFSPEDLEFLRIFGQRIGMEIERYKRAQQVAKAEEDRHASERLLASLLSLAPEGIIAADRDGRILVFNRGAEILFGYGEAEVLGKPLDVLMPSRLAAAHRDHVKEFEKAPDASRMMNARGMIMGMRKDGAEFPIEASIAKLTLNGGLVFTVLLRDVNERKRMENALREAKEDAEFSNRAKSEFLANMSHELRTPLNAIIGFSDMIAEERFGPVGAGKYLEYARDINVSGTYLLNLINDILDLSRIEAGNVELNEEEFAAAEIFDSAIRLLSERAKSGGVAIAITPSPALGVTIRADKRKFKQAVVNLLSNAIKFTEHGGTVTIKARHDRENGYVVAITDTGIGMAAEDIPKAFARFQQIDSTLSRKYEGTGLGLPLSKLLMEIHGGTLDLESERGRGTTVTLRLPADRIVRSVARPPSIENVGGIPKT
jgi:PAS domain S-box-containing protein